MKNYELESRKNVETNSSSLVLSNYQSSTAKNKIYAFKNQHFSATNGLSIDSLVKKLMKVVTEKEEIVSLVESKLIAQFGKFGSSEIWSNDLSNWLFLHN